MTKVESEADTDDGTRTDTHRRESLQGSSAEVELSTSVGTDNISSRVIPTVVVSRSVKTGHQHEAARWLRRLFRAAQRAQGHLGADIQEPSEAHPGQWVIVYRFETSKWLEAWLHSDTRLALIQEGTRFFEGSAREQILAVSDTGLPVTAVSSFRLRQGHEANFLGQYEHLLTLLKRFDGFLGCEHFSPVAGVQQETVVVFSFSSRAGLDVWLDSAVRRNWLKQVEPHLAADRVTNVVGGFAGWFASPGAVTVKRWKQAALVLIALYPTALVLGVLHDSLFPRLPFALGVLVGNVFGVAILSWVLMPWLTHLLGDWLRR